MLIDDKINQETLPLIKKSWRHSVESDNLDKHPTSTLLFNTELIG